MAELIAVTIKHAGKSYPVDVDVAAPATAFKQSIYQLTGVPTGAYDRAAGPSCAR